MIKYFIYGFLSIVFASCSVSYQRVLKSNDPDYKYEKAKEYYEDGDYVKALPIFEELISVFKGTKSIDDIYYMYAMCHYEQQNYLIAAFHFKNIHDSYPLSEYAEESLYMAAYSYYMMSPIATLDQTYTEKALDGFQLYINTYPHSLKIKECNQLMDRLRDKLEKKAFQNAQLYLKTGHYKAAATAFGNMVRNYPDSENADNIHFLVIKAYYLYAENSVPDKRIERYSLAVDAYHDYMDQFKGGKFQKDAEDLYESSLENIEKQKIKEKGLQ